MPTPKFLKSNLFIAKIHLTYTPRILSQKDEDLASAETGGAVMTVSQTCSPLTNRR